MRNRDAVPSIAALEPFKGSSFVGEWVQCEGGEVYVVRSYKTAILTVIGETANLNIRDYSDTTAVHRAIIETALELVPWKVVRYIGPEVKMEESRRNGGHGPRTTSIITHGRRVAA